MYNYGSASKLGTLFYSDKKKFELVEKLERN